MNINDGTNEGIRSRSRPFFSVQFHPEARPGPQDTASSSTTSCAWSARWRSAEPCTAPTCPTKPRRVLVLGSGALQIGQAGEFDYSGSQAHQGAARGGHRHRPGQPEHRHHPDQRRAGRPASTSPRSRPSSSSRSSSRRRSTPSCSSFGGQTALNCGLALRRRGRARASTACACSARRSKPIRDTEDRELFVERLARDRREDRAQPGVPHADEARAAAARDRPPGHAARRLRARRQGQRHRRDRGRARRGAASARSPAACRRCWSRSACAAGRRSSTRSSATRATTASPSATWRTSTRWASTRASRSSSRRRRRSTTTSTSCCAPIAIRTIRHLGIVGECNIQYALDPASTRLPRHRGQRAPVALVSARASKATGYPLAYVAAKIALGYTLPEIPNGITRRTTAFFEPALDYLVCKVPRWDLGKFHGASTQHRQRDEERRRGDGDRPHLPRGASRRRCACSTSACAGSIPTRSSSTTCATQLRNADAAAHLRDRAGAARRHERRRDPRAHPDRPLVPARDRADRRRCTAS